MLEMEKIIISAYTGYLMTDFDKVHEYIERVLNRPVWTHELGNEHIYEMIRERVKPDFMALCRDEFPPSFVGRI